MCPLFEGKDSTAVNSYSINCASIQTIMLVSPDAVEDEEELNEDATKRQDTSHEGGRDGVGKPALVWNLTRNLVGAHRLLHSLGGGREGGREGREGKRGRERERGRE